MIKPKFNKKMPKDAWKFLSPHSDDEFKKKHKVAYRVILAIGLFSLFAPMIAYFILMRFVLGVEENGLTLFGLFGTVFIGAGFFHIVGAWVGQYLGHKVTLTFFIFGAFLLTASSLFIFNENLHALTDEKFYDYQFGSFLFLGSAIFYYIFFRFRVDYFILNKSKRKPKEIIEMKRGKKDFWWYETIQKEIGLGWLYYFNKAITILYPATLAITLFTGFFKVMSFPIIILSLLIYISCLVMCIFCIKVGKRSAFVFSIIGIFALLLITWAHISILFGANEIKSAIFHAEM